MQNYKKVGPQKLIGLSLSKKLFRMYSCDYNTIGLNILDDVIKSKCNNKSIKECIKVISLIKKHLVDSTLTSDHSFKGFHWCIQLIFEFKLTENQHVVCWFKVKGVQMDHCMNAPTITLKLKSVGHVMNYLLIHYKQILYLMAK